MIERRLGINKAALEAAKIEQIVDEKGVDYDTADKLLDNYRSKERMEKLPFTLTKFSSEESRLMNEFLTPKAQNMLQLLRKWAPETFAERINISGKYDKYLTTVNKVFDLRKTIEQERGREVKLGFRVVSAKTDKELREIINRSVELGGKAPVIELKINKLEGVCIDSEAGYHGTEFLQRSLEKSLRTIVFVYDLNDLVPATEDDSVFTAGYGVKAKPGKKLKDALVGVMTFERRNKDVEEGKEFAEMLNRWSKITEEQIELEQVVAPPLVKDFQNQLIEMGRRLESNDLELDNEENRKVVSNFLYGDSSEEWKMKNIMNSGSLDELEEMIKETYPESPKAHFQEFIKVLDELIEDNKK